MPKMTDDEVLAELRSESPLNKARQAFYHWSAKIEQDAQQRRPAGPIETRRMEFDAVKAVICAYFGIEKIERALVEREPVLIDLDLDLTPEGYVRAWARNGAKSPLKLPAWEKVYQDKGLIDQAEALGYIRIGRDVACSISLTAKGKALVDWMEVRA